MKILMTFVVLLGCVVGASAQSEIPSAQPGQLYGSSFETNETKSVRELATVLTREDLYRGQIAGKVVEVCVKKGCFIKLDAGNGQDPIMVRFKDYGFFMPQDIVGKRIVLNGVASITETSVERLKHFAEDAGKSSSEIAKIKSPKTDVVIVASGVKVIR